MKFLKILPVAVCTAAIALVCAGCEVKAARPYLEKVLSLDLTDTSLIYDSNTGSGASLPGERMIKFDCSKDRDFEVQIYSWKRLPLPAHVSTYVYGVDYVYGEDEDFTGRMSPVVDIPWIEEGWYVFEDRFAQDEDDLDNIHNADALFTREGNFKFMVTVYDRIDDKLYYYEIDNTNIDK